VVGFTQPFQLVLFVLRRNPGARNEAVQANCVQATNPKQNNSDEEQQQQRWPTICLTFSVALRGCSFGVPLPLPSALCPLPLPLKLRPLGLGS
jgi:hypothetical protein